MTTNLRAKNPKSSDLGVVKEIRALLFDFGGTLDGNGIHWRERTYQFIQDQWPQIDREAFDQADLASVERFIASGRGPQCNLRETADAIAAGIFVRLGLHPSLIARYVGLFCEGVAESLARNRKWLAKLGAHYQLGVISNNFGNTQGWCDEYELSPHLDLVIDSAVVGISKPDTGIFHIALAELGVSPQAAIYVGDTYSHDMVGAKGAGLWTAWLVGEQAKECPDPSIIDIHLTQIQELDQFLE